MADSVPAVMRVSGSVRPSPQTNPLLSGGLSPVFGLRWMATARVVEAVVNRIAARPIIG